MTLIDTRMAPDRVDRHSTEAAFRAVKWDGTARGYVPSDPPEYSPAVRMHDPEPVDIDAVTYEVIRYALMSANLEHGDIISRLSMSPVVMVARDFQSTLMTESGDLVYLGSGVQYFSNQHALTVRYILEHRSEDGLVDGDIWVSNDPYIGSAHQSDVTLLTPLFVGDELFCWLSNSQHFADVGGSMPGSGVLTATDAFAEPMAWPPVRLVEGGRMRDDVEHLFARQSRVPHLTRMDLRAAIGAIGATREKISKLVDRYGADVVKGVMRRLIDSGQKVFAERIAKIPDGRWSHRIYTEGALPGDKNLYAYQFNITKKGDRLIIDNAGSDPQTGSINMTYAGFAGIAETVLTQQLIPDLAGAYGGAYRHIDVRPVPGLVSCADFPAAVSPSGNQTVMIMLNVAANAVCKMLASGGDDTRQLSLGAPGSNMTSLIGGGLTADGQQFILQNTDGLFGSLAGRPTRDGVDAGGQWWIPDSEIENIEQIESGKPFVVLGRRLGKAGLDGSGRYRAGVGFRATLLVRGMLGGQIVWYVNESFSNGQGLFGGNPGSVARARVKHGTDTVELMGRSQAINGIDDVHGEEEILPYKGMFSMADGDVIEWTSPAAAGYGDPLLRDPELVLADIEDGLATDEIAERVFGVVISDGRIDRAATERTRLGVRRERLGREPEPPVDAPEHAVQVGDVLHVVEGRWWSNGADLGPADESYRPNAVIRETRMRETGPEFDVLDTESADRFVLREYLCPVTGYRIDAEIALAGGELLEDVLIGRF
ncbi:hydantoinase B/oxoprolinase family protein [Agromyces sp. Marseille-P2726]|uniref:hydantoinase B/oxoprolinase family protein n=1 Tax=Agromyces sp. Marseille-P2726 TaxID=2709132 RepID=UPI001570A1C9|nr:hydantoinase B/oxoprolinase family protein [Agromyces sp. Marseille-P2726]